MSLSTRTRWCPTPEQLTILKEMYRNGVRTPKSSEIQKMTAHLSLYGKIQGKNVFYWFQNHKAREKQKLRRKFLMDKQHQELLFLQYSQPYHHLHRPNNFLGLLKDGDAHIKNYPAWRMDPPSPKQNFMMSKFCSSCDDLMMNMGNPKNADNQESSKMQMNSLPYFPEYSRMQISNNNEPLKTLQLFPINSTFPN